MSETTSGDINIQAVREYLLGLQTSICNALEAHEPSASFARDEWQRPEGGGGISRVLADGDVFERGGVNFSDIRGKAMPAAATAKRPELAGRSYQAMGVSLVMHPRNPYVPTTHLNVRFFCAEKPGHEPVWWFGGGFDLTPYYGFVEDAKHWHETSANACAPFHSAAYPRYKSWCDEYFYLKHRQEPRGIGGLFFDDLNGSDEFAFDFNTAFAFQQSVGDHFLLAYEPILERRKNSPYGERERQWQLHRRGRYVEFNLVWDRGTLFGLQSNGRTESILMSMPPLVSWAYCQEPEPNSAEAELLSDFLKPQDWLS